MLLGGGEPDHITGPNFLDWSTFALSPAAAGRNDQSLTERMRVPCSARARLERHARTLSMRRIRRLEQRIDANRPVNQSEGPLWKLVRQLF